MEYEFTDRYQALNIDYPDPETVCLGHCEGTGWVPIKNDDPLRDQEPWKTLWDEAEIKEPTDDGWQFVKCPECKGTGKRN